MIMRSVTPRSGRAFSGESVLCMKTYGSAPTMGSPESNSRRFSIKLEPMRKRCPRGAGFSVTIRTISGHGKESSAADWRWNMPWSDHG
jgi:hypothetical protein